MKRFFITLLPVICACSFSFSFAQVNQQQKKKIVLIPGEDSHDIGDHEHVGGCILLAKLLNENVPGVHAVVTEQVWPGDTTILDDAAAIVLYGDGAEGHMVIPHLDHMRALMNKGVGLVALHFAVEIEKAVAGPEFLQWLGGYFELNYSVNPHWKPSFTKFPDHPVTRGVKPFALRDEWYFHMRFNDDNSGLTPVLTALPPDSLVQLPDGIRSSNPEVRRDVIERKQPQTMAWAYHRKDGGRSFGFTGGHIHLNWMDDNFRKLVLNAIVWSAKGTVPANGIASPTPGKAYLLSLQKKKSMKTW